MSLKLESRKLWKSFPKTSLSITIMTEFQNVCDKIILEVGVVGLRELCEKLLIHLRLQANNVITSLAHEDAMILSVDECNDDDDDDDDVATSLTDDEMNIVHSVANRLRVSRSTEDITEKTNVLDKIKPKNEFKPVKKPTHPCSQCDKSFIGTVSLNNHVLRKHPLQKESGTMLISQNNDSVVSNNKNISSCEESITISQGVTVKSDQDSNVTKSHQDVKCVAECPNLSQRKLSSDKVTTLQQVVSSQQVVANNKALSSTLVKVLPVSQICEQIALQSSVGSKTYHSQFGLAHHVESPALCLESGKTYATPAHLHRHQRIHTGERPYVCYICRKTFSDSSTLKIHLLEHSDEPGNVCAECGNRFRTIQNLRVHIRRTHKFEECQYLCMKCGKRFALVNDMKVHEVKCKRGRTDACPQCSKRFTNADRVQKHIMEIHKGGHQFESSICSEVFSSSLRLARQVNDRATKESTLNNNVTKESTINNHTTKRSIVCLVCGKMYTTPANLRRHQRVHTGERPFVCKTCDKTFNDMSTLKKHNLNHTDERAHVCFECGKGYRSNFTLVAHFRRMHNLDGCPYMCVKCGKKCAVANDLQVHEVGCKGERPYACPQCNKRFSTAGNVTKHLQVHSGEKPYACSLCDQKFTQACSVREHVRVIHNGERLFQCIKCNYRGSTRSELKRHDLVHTHERPYSCKQCHKTFSRLSFLKMHESKH